jgi:hypothetical protein
VVLLLMSVLSGLSGLISPPGQRSQVIEEAFGSGAIWLYLALVAGPLVGLVGGFWPNPQNDAKSLQIGMQIERAGMPVFAGACFAYSVAVFASSGLRAVIAGALIFGIGLAALLRTRQITVDLHVIRAILASADSEPAEGDT